MNITVRSIICSEQSSAAGTIIGNLPRSIPHTDETRVQAAPDLSNNPVCTIGEYTGIAGNDALSDMYKPVLEIYVIPGDTDYFRPSEAEYHSKYNRGFDIGTFSCLGESIQLLSSTTTTTKSAATTTKGQDGSASATTTKASDSNAEPSTQSEHELSPVGGEDTTNPPAVTTQPLKESTTQEITTKTTEKPSAPTITTPLNNDGGAIELPMIPIG